MWPPAADKKKRRPGARNAAMQSGREEVSGDALGGSSPETVWKVSSTWRIPVSRTSGYPPADGFGFSTLRWSRAGRWVKRGDICKKWL